MEINVLESRPAGYAYLLDKLGLTGMPHWHTSLAYLICVVIGNSQI